MRNVRWPPEAVLWLEDFVRPIADACRTVQATPRLNPACTLTILAAVLLTSGCATDGVASGSAERLVVEACVVNVSGPAPHGYCTFTTSEDCGVWALSLSHVHIVSGAVDPRKRFLALYIVDDNGHVLSAIPPPPLLPAERGRRRLSFTLSIEEGAYVLTGTARTRG